MSQFFARFIQNFEIKMNFSIQNFQKLTHKRVYCHPYIIPHQPAIPEGHNDISKLKLYDNNS